MATDTKTALLNSAEQTARTRGFDGFSYADLAEDVGIRKASIHHYFSTKAKLSVELMLRYHNELQLVCARIDDTEATGAARLGALIDRYRVALDGGKSLCSHIISLALSSSHVQTGRQTPSCSRPAPLASICSSKSPM